MTISLIVWMVCSQERFVYYASRTQAKVIRSRTGTQPVACPSPSAWWAAPRTHTAESRCQRLLLPRCKHWPLV